MSELEANQTITTSFLVQSKEVRQKKTGEPYLSLVLGDRTGEIEAKMWDNVTEVMDTFDRDDFVKVKGLVQLYQNRPQLTIHRMVRIDDSAVDMGDYFPVSKRDRGEMFAELKGIVAGMGNAHLRKLVEAFLNDEAIAEAYRTAPAAKSVHHAYLGGLLEHVLSLCTLGRMTAAHYQGVDFDLLLTGIVLHDIGKLSELSYQRSFGYTDEGQLLGHIVIGLRMLSGKLEKMPEFPPALRVLVEHLIVSHHGELEFGSPKAPLFPEAMLLHMLDNMDSKMECMRALLARDAGAEGWTAYSAPLGRAVLRKERFLSGGGGGTKPEPAGKAEAKTEGPRGQAKQEKGPVTGSLFGEKLLGALQDDE